jgi:WD40 repeat protein
MCLQTVWSKIFLTRASQIWERECEAYHVYFIIFGQVASSAAENVNIWNLKTGEKTQTLSSGEKHEVSSIAINRTGQTLAAGYEDGSLRLFDLETGK